MVLCQPQLWQLLLLMCLGGLLQTDVCGGQNSVQIQEGPLYRVKGFPMSISCNVSGLKDSREQAFEFLVTKPQKSHPIQIISTKDPGYPYAVYSKRVHENDILIERLSWTSVRFHIKSVKDDDSGKYDCHTPNPHDTYSGTYNAETTVNVIEDTLMASYSGPASYSISEGESLQLECQVSSQTFQHTHLSVTWYLRGTADTRPIISLDRDLVVRPGPEFLDRYRSGLIAIEKIEDTTYRLKISQVQQSDSGEIYCQAEEWIQDPDRSWFRICHRNTMSSNLKVKALDTAHEVGTFVPQIRVLNPALEEGGVMEIQCSIDAQNLPGHVFSMAWLRNNMEVAHIGPTGVVSVAKTSMRRENDGELRTVKKGDRIFVLTIQPVRAEDQGIYQCKAEQEEKTDTGSFIRGKSQLSREETVHIKAKESGLAVVMPNQLINITEGEALQISCSVSGAKGLLSVSWQHTKSSGSSFGDVITLSHEGVVKGPQYQHRGLRTFQANVADFILELSGALLSDSGVYKCTVTEWSMESSGNPKKGSSQSQQGQVSVKSIESLVKVTLKSRTVSVLENSVIRLICSVYAPKVSLAMTWKFLQHNSSTQKNIINMDHTGSISWEAEQQDYQLETLVQESRTDFILMVLKARKRQAGRYECQIDAYDKNVQKTTKPLQSNPLAITVHRPDSKLSVSSPHKSSLKIQANSDSIIDCLVMANTTNSSRFEVTWLHRTQTLLKMEPEGVITHETDDRISMKRTTRQTFQLMIKQVKSTDSGPYICSVQEWIQDPDGIWYSLDTKSVTVELHVIEKESDFSMDKSADQLKVLEGEQFELKCSLGSGGLDTSFRYSLSWLFQSQDQSLSTVKLLTYTYDGRLQFQESDPEVRQRLIFSRPTINVFQLSVLNSMPSDSGSYYCQVDQYQVDCKSKWARKSSDTSGLTNVSVQLLESKLRVDKVDHFLNITDTEKGFVVVCKISSRSSDESVFEVSWSRRQRDERALIIYTASRDGTLHSAIPDKTLVYDRPSTSLYTLTVPNVDLSDNGHYQCQVVEWLQTADNIWRKVAEDKSGEMSINVQVETKSSKDTFTLQMPITRQNYTEGESLDITCSINFDNMDPTFHYSIKWSVERQFSSVSTILLSHTYNGILQYNLKDKQLNGRLLFFRPAANNMRLTISKLDLSDSGKYNCMVEQYQFSCEGNWEIRGSPQFLSTMVNVYKKESKLRVDKVDHFLNITDTEKGFVVVCKISSRSSDESVFEVSWSRRQRDERPLIIYTASRDGTLHSAIPDKTMVYDRPSTSLYTLTVPNVGLSDNGHYQCQVKEWLQTADNAWRYMNVDKSGELFISVHARPEGRIDDKPCSSGLILVILIPLLCILLMVVLGLSVLLNKVQKTITTSKIQKQSLWLENTPLKAMAETETEQNTEDSA